ncbi:hypothetical protein PV08_01162 [Exophiala spinifera]|uniref:Uncharacterized protein n=1 Tax=Exophiala spinifera TaxID=91928 RepID=A0A0D2A749_9EURO|nr:uncharacterized protein PV08_01162 [Exophiala spinifera]KIW20587.1 hypothetical protein PV08_01162 [Exophiala spinifera]
MAPNFMKGQTDTSQYTGTKPDTPATDPNNNNYQNYNPASGDKKSSTGAPLLSSEGAVGKQFKPEGAIGSVGEAVGGPLASDGAIGKNFTPDGSVGGTINNMVGGPKKD